MSEHYDQLDLSRAVQDTENRLKKIIAKQKKELAALHDKSRWRKQSVEPAPKGIEVLLFDAYRKVFLIDTYCYKPDVDYVYWRPLDLPEV